MKTKTRLYRVIFTNTRHMRIELEARSPTAAIKAAERAYLEGDPTDDRFRDTGGDAFHDAWAERVRP